jgi:hypothetical protein
MAARKEMGATNFATVPVAEISRKRASKHSDLTQRVVSDIPRLPPGSALQIRIADLDTELANARAALNRACRAAGIKVRTSTDSKYLYVWPARPLRPKWTKSS